MFVISKALITTSLLCVVIVGSYGFAQAPQVLSTSPAQNELNVELNSDVEVTFSEAMYLPSINNSSFIIASPFKGRHTGTITTIDLSTYTFNPEGDFFSGEIVEVILTRDVQSLGLYPLTNGYSWSFTAKSESGIGIFLPQVEYPAGGLGLSTALNV